MSEGAIASQGRYREYTPAFFEDAFVLEKPHGVGVTTDKPLNNHISVKRNVVFLSRILLMVYGIGVLFFIFRLLWLWGWLKKLIKTNHPEPQGKYTVFYLEKEVPPFSFFRYIFVAKEAAKLNEFEQILEHELVHARQWHSLDLFLAHVIAVFQWFNPLVWHIQKAIKTNHEYLADSRVVGKGYELFDYQTLLLSQLISLRSVALVNNFNLVSIKKRIQMMTKNKSGFSARLKALIVIPSAVVVFFLFAQMTVKSPVWRYSNYNTVRGVSFAGIWQNTSSGAYGQLISFENNTLSILESESGVSVIEIPIVTNSKHFEFKSKSGKTEIIPYVLEGDVLKVWWTQNEVSEYSKTPWQNSGQGLIPYAAKDFNLPITKVNSLLEKPSLILDVVVLSHSYVIAGKEVQADDLLEVMLAQRLNFKVVDREYITVRIFADKQTQMKGIYKLYSTLRKAEMLKVAYAVQPKESVSKLQYHMSAIPMSLPPLHAEMLEKSKIGKKLITIVPENGAKDNRKAFLQHIEKYPDYICSYEWKNSTKYGDYLAQVDMMFDVMYTKREELAQLKYKDAFANLPNSIKKEIRKQYPLQITFTNLDED
jgi:biopolymer transport protein ExbD